jgi:glycosyltransferase involved in cell wall biosynthesis
MYPMQKSGNTLVWICDRAMERGGIARSLADIYPFLKPHWNIEFLAPVNARFEQLESAGAKVHRVLSRFPRSRGHVWVALSVVPAIRHIERIRPSAVIVDHTNGLRIMNILKSLGYAGPIIYRNHGAEFLQRRPRRSRRMLSCCSSIITVCESEAKTISALTAAPVEVIPNCVPAHALRGNAPPKVTNLNIGYIGWVSEDKGIFAFMEAVKKIVREAPAAKGIIRGSIVSSTAGQQEGRVIRDAIANRKFCSYEGETSRQNVFDDLMFLVVTSRRESFSLSILEAPFHGVLPIAFDTIGPHSLLGPVAPELLVPWSDADGVTERVLELWKDVERRQAVIERLRSSFQGRFNPAKIADKFLRVFENHATTPEKIRTAVA